MPKKGKKTKIRKEIIQGLAIMSILLIVVLSTVIGLKYYNDQMDSYENQAIAYTKTVAEYIDGDRVLPYVESLEKDDYYYDIQNYLNLVQKNTDILYYYVFVPCEDDLIYVWDADNYEGACELGYHEEYMDGGKEIVDKTLRKDPILKMKSTTDKTYGYIGSVYYPIFNSKDEAIALVGLDISMQDVDRTIHIFIAIIVMVVVISILIIMSLLAMYINSRVVDPIAVLNKASKELVSNLENDRDFSVEVGTTNEISELADSFGQMHIGIKEYIDRLSKVTAEKERIGAELNIATKIQEAMLPSIFPPFPEVEELDIYATMDPAKEVGGDFYDFFKIDNDHIGLVIADVSGKGVPAALFMVIAKILIKDQALMGGTPAEILERVNDLLCENNKVDMFVTVWMGIIDVKTGDIIAANAGHEFPAIRRADGNYELFKDKHGFVVAGMEGMKYKDYEIKLEPGDRLFVYTDGVAEATNSENELFGTDRMLEALNKNPGANCTETLVNVTEGINAFVKEAPQFDDITMLCLEYR